jgi:hypothetical protein
VRGLHACVWVRCGHVGCEAKGSAPVILSIEQDSHAVPHAVAKQYTCIMVLPGLQWQLHRVPLGQLTGTAPSSALGMLH